MNRIAVWLIIIGVVSLLVPNPAWPRFVGSGIVVAGIVFGVIALVKRSREKKAEHDEGEGTLL